MPSMRKSRSETEEKGPAAVVKRHSLRVPSLARSSLSTAPLQKVCRLPLSASPRCRHSRLENADKTDDVVDKSRTKNDKKKKKKKRRGCAGSSEDPRFAMKANK